MKEREKLPRAEEGSQMGFPICIFFLDGVLLHRPGWRAMAQSRLTATSPSQVQAILIPE